MSDSLTLEKVINELDKIKEGDVVTEQQRFIIEAAIGQLEEWRTSFIVYNSTTN